MYKVFLYGIILFLSIICVGLAALVNTFAQGDSTKSIGTVFSAMPGPDVSTLQRIADGSTTDDAILQAVVTYFEENRERLAVLWREEDPTRLAGLFSMYVVHISTIYGETTFPSTLQAYLNLPTAHCGTYTWAQAQIADALGLTWRSVEFVGDHAWLELLVHDQWEIFDATTNVWISRGVEEDMQGMPRSYRRFYTPVLDVNRLDTLVELKAATSQQELRQNMPSVGIIYMPFGELRISPAHAPS